MKLDVALSSETPVKIESKSFNGELVGNLTLTGTTNALGLLGEVRLNSGDVYFRNQHYQILKARANFDNPFRIAANIDVEANAQILDYDVTVHAQGDFSKPKLFFNSTPSLPQKDLVSLISFGFTSREYRDSLGVAQSAGLEALSMYSGIGTQVLKAIPGSAFDEFRLGTLYSPIGGGATPSVVIGMQTLGKMRLRFQTGLVTNLLGNREKRLELEKYINKNWRWRASWDSEGITNYGDAGVDLWFRWDY
jgi:translocation and assembly module TamB